ncbi:tyrosine-type recombinase/integrase [Paeniglutamicibacter antarcticus]|uniref:Tyrosine-type recombinase/integrase n=2 Tax=Arthrobacter terrae TaxID=2935737 RepID=A0A931CVQ0_9MICC|nr:tyrosine-type recombinase/integrase [Arthrobacter terrae]
MLENYFKQPATVDRYMHSWVGAEIEQYVVWLSGNHYSDRCVWRRVPLVFAFGEFAGARGAGTVGELPAYVGAFVDDRVALHHKRTGSSRSMAKEIRGPVEQMLTVILPGYQPSGRRRLELPFAETVPGFIDYLIQERGLRPLSVGGYRIHLRQFEAYLHQVGMESMGELSPALISAYLVARAGTGLAKSTVRDEAGALKVFLRYAHREGVLASDLSTAVGWAQTYRLSDIPRSISWADVNLVLAGVDRRTVAGKRDYAILMLLVIYGLRGREVAALTLDDIDWKRERLAIPERKAGHSTAFPLSAVVGEALLDYLQHGRPESEDRRVFFRAMAPRQPITAAAVSARTRIHLLKAGIDVRRPGSHTLRHTAVQRLVDANFSLKTIGDFVGHRSARSTEVYAKVDIEALREVALGDGEEVLW